MSIFVISTLEIGCVPVSKQFEDISCFGQIFSLDPEMGTQRLRGLKEKSGIDIIVDCSARMNDVLANQQICYYLSLANQSA